MRFKIRRPRIFYPLAILFLAAIISAAIIISISISDDGGDTSPTTEPGTTDTTPPEEPEPPDTTTPSTTTTTTLPTTTTTPATTTTTPLSTTTTTSPTTPPTPPSTTTTTTPSTTTTTTPSTTTTTLPRTTATTRARSVDIIDTSLSGIATSSGTLRPAFVSGTLTYALNVANTATSLTVAPTASVETGTTITVRTATDEVVASGTASSAISLPVGNTTITIQVTALDSPATNYRIVVTREPAVEVVDTSLSGLTVSEGTLDPTFASGIIFYRVDVANSVNSLTVNPTATTATRTIVTVNGSLVTSGSNSSAIALSEGQNTINIRVTADTLANQQTNAPTNYIILVIRAAN